MRELFLVNDQSTPAQLVFSTNKEVTDDAELYSLDLSPQLAEQLGALLDGGVGGGDTADDAAAGKDTAAAEDAEEPLTNGDAATAEAATPSSASQAAAPSAPAPATPTPARSSRPHAEPDPGLSAPLTMRPREIQDRIRAGASIEELAEAMGVANSRVEAFAHPVLVERGRMVEVAKTSHPLRDDGPAKLTLAEVLATAFAARGVDYESATWDAFRESGSHQWTVAVSWQVGQSHNRATWNLQYSMTSPATTAASNELATELTNPESVQPTRPRPLAAVDPITEEIPPVREETTADNLLRHPTQADEVEERRRRKAVTPHWEDVLLGVRTNTKRPKK